MLSDTTRAVVLEALEYRKRKTIEFGDFTPKEAEEELAELNAAIAEVNAEAQGEWRPVNEWFYQYPSGNSGLVYIRSDAHGRPQLRHYIDEGETHCRETIMVFPDHIRLFERTGSQEAAQDDKP